MRDRDDLLSLARRAELGSVNSHIKQGGLDAAVVGLRREWLSKAHRPADATLKSPCEGEASRMPDGESVRFGYERDLDPDWLERRTPLCHPVPSGWQSVRVLCRSGQAALSCLLHLIARRASSGPGAPSRPLTMLHAGRYFETTGLLALWPRSVFAPADPSEARVDVLIGEPVHCDGQFGLSDPALVPRARQALLLDTTLTGLDVDLSGWLASLEGSFAAIFRSGLKLDQAGLELANVGIIQLFVRVGSAFDAVSTADELKHIRALTGSGLTLDEMGALSAPWFLDRSYLAQYTSRLFANNAALAAAIGTGSILFDDRCHPSLISPGAVAPFCAIRLRNGDASSHVRLLHRVEDEIARRTLKLDKGGSFGSRADRYELIEPDPEAGQPFLRVAMGYRGGANRDGIIDLFHELAALPSLP
ncbi:hypothetical protein [Reyranella sp.]|uniref:hypothetical protein n=1 Tax=Reyranella sp. TaxID=1929291 RepID=UPI003D0C2495